MYKYNTYIYTLPARGGGGGFIFDIFIIKKNIMLGHTIGGHSVHEDYNT